MDRSSDDALLLAARRDAEAFAEFYRRHARPLAGYLLRRTGDAEAAADLLAETFAAALTGLNRFDPGRGDGAGWLYGIARHQLARRARRGAVEERARRRLGMERLELDDADLRARDHRRIPRRPARLLLRRLHARPLPGRVDHRA
jgi:DNA-directed RNA polymerase specialized sigma24 family protein